MYKYQKQTTVSNPNEKFIFHVINFGIIVQFTKSVLMSKFIPVLALLFTTQAYSQLHTMPMKDSVFLAHTAVVSGSELQAKEKNTQQAIIAPGEKSIYTKYGVASFYSRSLEGTKTATGETFHHKKMTAASNTFKLNTWVRVTNLRNGKSVIVRINDRMHPKMAKRGRIVDLSRIAASKLDFVYRGIVKVRVEEVSKETID